MKFFCFLFLQNSVIVAANVATKFLAAWPQGQRRQHETILAGFSLGGKEVSKPVDEGRVRGMNCCDVAAELRYLAAEMRDRDTKQAFLALLSSYRPFCHSLLTDTFGFGIVPLL